MTNANPSMSYVLATDLNPEVIVSKLVEGLDGQRYGSSYKAAEVEYNRAGFSGDCFCSEIYVDGASNTDVLWEAADTLVGKIESSYILVTEAKPELIKQCAKYLKHKIIFEENLKIGKDGHNNYLIEAPESKNPDEHAKQMEDVINYSYKRGSRTCYVETIIPKAKTLYVSWGRGL